MNFSYQSAQQSGYARRLSMTMAEQHRPKLFLICLVLVPLAAATPALASDPARHEVGNAVTMLAPVVVKGNTINDQELLEQDASSATHTNVSIFNMPASVDSVTSGQMIRRGHYRSVNAVTRTVGISAHGTPGGGGLNFTSRGFGSVGVAVGGIRAALGSGTTNYPSLTWGYKRVDVLRGPGSLLYGSGNMGATINFVRKKPSREFGTDILLGIGRYDTARAGLGITGPLSDTLSFRVDAYAESTHNERELSRAENYKIASTLRWEPTQDLTLDFIFDYSNRRPERYFGIPLVDGDVLRSMRENNYNTTDSAVHYRDWRYRINAEWEVNDWLTVNNALYHFKSERLWKNIEMYDYQPATDTVARSLYLKIGHDLQQTGNTTTLEMALGRHDVALGWSVSRSEFTHINNSPYKGSSVVSASNPDHGHWSSPSKYVKDMHSELMHYALFVEDAWHLSTQWLLMAGIRSDWYDFSNEDLDGDAATDEYGMTLQSLSGRLGVTYILNERTRLYVQATAGHDPVDSLLSLDKSVSDFELTQGRQIEAGIKQQLPHDHGGWTLAVYRIKKTDIVTNDPDNPRESIQGGERVSRGVELTGRFHVTNAFTLEGDIAYTDSWFEKLWIQDNGQVVSYEGREPANVPAITANLWGHYRFNSEWKASVGLRHVGERYTSKANDRVMPEYTLVDAVISWHVNEHATLSLKGRNLTDEFYVTSSYGSQWLLGTGRTYGLTLKMNY